MHIYELDGKSYPSVTTILHILGDDILIHWANAMGLYRHLKYDDIMDSTSKFGTLIHSHLQAIIDPDNAETPVVTDPITKADVNRVLNHFTKFLECHTYHTFNSEMTLVSPRLGYAGTLDWLAEIDGVKRLNDFKTAKKPRLHMFLQLGGYYNLCVDRGITDIEGGSIININKKECVMTPINKECLLYCANIFDQLAKFYFDYKNLESQLALPK